MADFAILKWATARTRGHDNVDPADNLKECWGNGLTWCALLYAYFPDKLPNFPNMTCKTEAEHIAACKMAFDVATEAGCEPYLDPEDIVLVQDKKSILVYLSEIYTITQDLPLKFQSSAIWESKWAQKQKDEQMTRIRARMEADRAGTPQPLGGSAGGGGKKQSLAEKMATKRAEEEAREKEEQEALRQKVADTAPAKSREQEREERERKEREEQERERAEAIKKQEAERKAKEESEKLRKKEEEEAKRAEFLAATKKPAPVATTGNIPGTLTFVPSGAGAKGGPAKKLLIFTASFTIDGKKVEGTKDDLIVYVDGPSTGVRVNVMGGTGGAYHIGFTPTEPGQHWIDFVFKGNWSPEPFLLPIKNNFNKTPDFAYTGKERNSK